jgi:hypothetical protein
MQLVSQIEARRLYGVGRRLAKFRPGYAPQVATAILGFVGRNTANIDAADIGAGTGIWTRTLAARLKPDFRRAFSGRLGLTEHIQEWLQRHPLS